MRKAILRHVNKTLTFFGTYLPDGELIGLTQGLEGKSLCPILMNFFLKCFKSIAVCTFVPIKSDSDLQRTLLSIQRWPSWNNIRKWSWNRRNDCTNKFMNCKKPTENGNTSDFMVISEWCFSYSQIGWKLHLKIFPFHHIDEGYSS